jgi:hypothetical protein
MFNKAAIQFQKLRSSVNWPLLLFLLLFLDVKLAVKLVAIMAIYVWRFDFKFGFSSINSRLPLFYPLLILIGCIDLFLNGNLSTHNYLPVFFSGIGFWLICILAIHQIKLFVELENPEKLHDTVKLFFVLNAIVSLLDLLVIVCHTKSFNPYLYQGEFQKYFVNTGDFIHGITFDNSTTNAVLNAMGVLYFLSRKNVLMVLVCTWVMLMAGSNFTNVIIFGILALIFIFKSTREQKSVIIICGLLAVVFMTKVSPQNVDYVANTIRMVVFKKPFKSPWPVPPVKLTLRPDSMLNPEERRLKMAMLYLDSLRAGSVAQKAPVVGNKKAMVTETGKILMPKPNLDAPEYQNLPTTPPEQKQLADFVAAHRARLPISGLPNGFFPSPGKVMGLKQTVAFLKSHPAKILTGAGMGNFSSKLAFRATGLKFTGGYPAKLIYISHDFLVNHLDIYLNFFSRGAYLHSLTNSPFSVYDQLLAEYGLLGLTALFVLYLWFFAKNYPYLSYGLPLFLLVSALFFIDYWFEQLSVIVMLELLLFLNIKEIKTSASV